MTLASNGNNISYILLRTLCRPSSCRHQPRGIFWKRHIEDCACSRHNTNSSSEENISVFGVPGLCPMMHRVVHILYVDDMLSATHGASDRQCFVLLVFCSLVVANPVSICRCNKTHSKYQICRVSVEPFNLHTGESGAVCSDRYCLTSSFLPAVGYPLLCRPLTLLWCTVPMMGTTVLHT